MTVEITRLSACLGATVTGLDPSQPIDEETSRVLRGALVEHCVLILPGLDPTPSQHLAVAQAFGKVLTSDPGPQAGSRPDLVAEYSEIAVVDSEIYKFDYWHSDNTVVVAPPVGTTLVMRQCPPQGGDTMWLSTRRAYETLAPSLQTLCDGLRARHGVAPRGAEHRVVVKHPGNGAKHLYLSRGWTKSIVGFPPHQSDALLALLFEHLERPEHTVRWPWAEGDFGVWDNRTTNHYAINDYGTERRIMHRVTITADADST